MYGRTCIFRANLTPSFLANATEPQAYNNLQSIAAVPGIDVFSGA
jgi:hypothetical protein